MVSFNTENKWIGGTRDGGSSVTPEGQSSISRTQIKRWGMEPCAFGPQVGLAERGRILGLKGQSPA